MESLTPLIGLCVVWLLVVMLPGPNFVVVTRSALAGPGRTGMFAAAGVSLGAAVWAVTAIFGLAALFRYAGWLYDLLRLLGGAYLVFMGLRSLWGAVRRPGTGDTATACKPAGPRAAFSRGLLCSFSNPKTAVFFGSLFLTALPPSASRLTLAMTPALVAAISMTWYGAVALVFSLPDMRRIYRRAARAVEAVAGTALVLLGGRLLLSRD